MIFTNSSERDRSELIKKAVKEVFAIRNLLNKVKDARFKITDIVIQVCTKYDIPFNVLDRIINWAVRDNSDMSCFVKLNDLHLQYNISKKEIKDIANKNYITILILNGTTVTYINKEIIKYLN